MIASVKTVKSEMHAIYECSRKGTQENVKCHQKWNITKEEENAVLFSNVTIPKKYWHSIKYGWPNQLLCYTTVCSDHSNMGMEAALLFYVDILEIF